MKKITVTLLAIFISLSAIAQWVSPGNGIAYTLDDLSGIAPQAVSKTQNGVFQINQSLTFSTGDTLRLDASLQHVTVSNGVSLIIEGVILSDQRQDLLPFIGDSTGTEFFRLELEDAATAFLTKIHFQYGQQILLSNSVSAMIDGCEFNGFSNNVINYMNCNPTIQNCHFHHNAKAAISSAVNMNGSPKILNNLLYNNDLSNANIPQINIGPGATDTIIISGNVIEGLAQNMSGGIGIMNMGSSQTTLLVTNNRITHNRYGYTQNGANIYAIITDNIICDNNLETNPNNGGSGISIYGSNTTCRAKIRHNLIYGNLWGITAIYNHDIDMGTTSDPGGNVLYNNSNNNVEYELYNNSTCNMNAVGNYWGSNEVSHAENVIFHQTDNSSYGLVTYEPILELEPEILSFNIYQALNPELNQDLNFNFTAGGDTLFAIYNFDCVNPLPTQLIPTITMPLGVTCTPAPTEAQNFDAPVEYTLTTPHGSQRIYWVEVRIYGAVEDYDGLSVTLSPNPVSDGQFTLHNENGKTLQVEIHSLTGQLVYKTESADSSICIHAADWEKGIYLITLSQEGKTKTFKVVNL